MAIAQARRNEQDPVRCAMLTGFADLPPSIWRAEHLDLLSQVINDALNAADLSNATGSAVESLIVAILPFHPARSTQQLVTPFLGQLAYSGRFSTGKTRFVLPFVKGFGRWTPTQQRIFVETLNEITQDEQRDTPTLLRVITQLAALPSVAPARLIELASHLHTKLALRDAALRALSHLDTGLGIPTLIAAMDDDRARIAIYALRRLLMEMPVKGAVQLLLAVPMTKVTVAKEVATDPLTASLRVSLAVSALPGEELVAVFEQLAAGGEMHAEVLFDAVQKIYSIKRNSISDLTEIEVALATSNDDRLRRLALAALVVQSQAYGWNEKRKEKLHVFRHDPSSMVAAAAQFTLLPDD